MQEINTMLIDSLQEQSEPDENSQRTLQALKMVGDNIGQANNPYQISMSIGQGQKLLQLDSHSVKKLSIQHINRINGKIQGYINAARELLKEIAKEADDGNEPINYIEGEDTKNQLLDIDQNDLAILEEQLGQDKLRSKIQQVMQDEDRENDVRTMAAGENGDGDKAFEFEHSQQDDLSSGEAVEGKKKRPADKMSQAGLYQVRKQLKENLLLKKITRRLSEEEIIKIKADISSGNYSRQELSDRHRVHAGTISRHIQAMAKAGEKINLRARRHYPGRETVLAKLKELYKQYPKLLKHQAINLIKLELGFTLSLEKLTNYLHEIGMSPNKRHPASQQGNTQTNLYYRYLYTEQVKKLEEKKIIFLDETVYRVTASGDRAEQVTYQVNIAIALGIFGIAHWKLKSREFESRNVKDFLLELSSHYSGFTFILDNAKIHKSDDVKEAMAKAKIKALYLPPFSPQLNPIQSLFREIKGKFQKRISTKDTPHKLLQKANQLLMQLKGRSFEKEFIQVQKFVELAEQKKPLPWSETAVHSS